jgi:hypothetical protein
MDEEYKDATWMEVDDALRGPFVSYRTLLAMKEAAGRDKDLQDIAALRKLDPYR